MTELYDKLRSTVLANLGIDHTATGDLLQLYFTKALAPELLAHFFFQYDIELLEFQNVWLLSRLANRLHYAGVPKAEFPRVKGIVKRFTVENGRHFCVLPNVLEAFNRADVAVMLLNGTAMKVFYEPTETRYQNDIAILAHKSDVEKADRILEEQGFRLVGSFWGQRVYQKNDVRIVLHSTYLRANVLTGNLADIWQHTREISWMGKKAFVPCPEMMLLILLVQGLEACCARIQDAQNNYFVNCFLDSKFFMDSCPLDWDKFVELAKMCGLTLQARLMLDVLYQLYPGSLPKVLLEALPYTDKNVVNVQRLVLYNMVKKQVAEARERRNQMVYYFNGVSALWNLNCYYGNRSSLFENVLEFPKFISMWNNHKGIKGLLSKVGGYKK